MFTTVFLWNLVRNIRREIDTVKGTDTVTKTMKLVYIEQVNNMFHMYDTVNHTFICQAQTDEELWAIAKTKFPGKDIITFKEEVKHI
jgi:hypothetical protein